MFVAKLKSVVDCDNYDGETLRFWALYCLQSEDPLEAEDREEGHDDEQREVRGEEDVLYPAREH